MVAGSGLYGGTYTSGLNGCYAQAGFDCAYGFLGGNTSGDELIIEVATTGWNGSSPTALALDEIVDPTSLRYPGSAYQDNAPDATMAASSAPTTSVPEPSGLAILVSALGLFGFARRMSRKA